MKLTSKVTLRGVELTIGEAQTNLRKPDPNANQESPRGNYVYAHVDPSGAIFYVGRRAWSAERHPLWHRYVQTHLGGKYAVRILQDNLSSQESEELEAAWIDQCSLHIVNWQNFGRKTDFQALDRYHKLSDANHALIAQAKSVEKTDLEQAILMYVQAIEAIKEYVSISYEEGLVAQLLQEEANELGRHGEN